MNKNETKKEMTKRRAGAAVLSFILQTQEVTVTGLQFQEKQFSLLFRTIERHQTTSSWWFVRLVVE